MNINPKDFEFSDSKVKDFRLNSNGVSILFEQVESIHSDDAYEVLFESDSIINISAYRHLSNGLREPISNIFSAIPTYTSIFNIDSDRLSISGSSDFTEGWCEIEIIFKDYRMTIV